MSKYTACAKHVKSLLTAEIWHQICTCAHERGGALLQH